MLRTFRASALTVVVIALSALPVAASHSAPVITEPAEGAFVGGSGIVTIRGTAAGDALSVQVFEGTTYLGETAVLGGAWEVDVPLNDGSRTVRAVAESAGGSFSPFSSPVTFTVDTVAPALPMITAPANGSLLSFDEITIEGLVEPFATVELEVDTGATMTALAAHDGTWSVSRRFTNATHTVRARAIDRAGNRSALTQPVSFTVDTFAPAAPRIDTPAAGSATNQTQVLVSGAAEAGSTVTVYSSVALGSVTAGGGGTWQMLVGFTQGSHHIFARARDAAGNVSASSAITTFTVDLTPPAAPVIFSPAEGAVVHPSTATLSGSAEPHATVELVRTGIVVATATADGAGAWSMKLPNLPDGQATVTVRARDKAGNIGAESAPRSFIVDGTAPTVRITTSSGSVFTPSNPPRIVGTAADAAGVASITLDFYDITGRGVYSSRSYCVTCPTGTSVSWENTSTPLFGRFVVRAYALDRAGNKSSYDEIVVWIVRTS